MLDNILAKGMTSANPEVKRKALRLRLITIIEDYSRPVPERLDDIEQAFEKAGWIRPASVHDVDRFYKE